MSTILSDPLAIDEEADVRGLVHLRAGGVSVVVDCSGGRLPTLAHWGADLGEPGDDQLAGLVRAGQRPYRDSPFDVASQVALVPEHGAGWMGRPGVEGSRQGRAWSPDFRVRSTQRAPADDEAGERLVVEARDDVAELGLGVELELRLTGLLRARATLTNLGAEAYVVGALRLTLPVPAEADELLDFTGRHTMERIPQRHAFTVGQHSREAYGGRPGLDAAYLLAAGSAGFGFRGGEIWGVHLAWSGNQVLYAERQSNGARLLGGGERLDHGEVVLARDEAYVSPWLYGTYGVGLDRLADRFHRELRRRPAHPRRDRPVILNTWEAVYMRQDLDTLAALADRAATVGVERFVLDDGWFGSRRDDHRGLGDWTVSPDVWPRGLGPLIDHVHERGMEFGLWVEPEMVNLDSDLARTHPEWLFRAGGRQGMASRQQHVLDLGHPEAYTYIRDALNNLLDEYDIAYLKWDHNRPLSDAGHGPGGEAGVHRHTAAVYRLLDELHAAHPGLEIESCAGGGGRVDLGILAHTDRVWPSDCIDPLERQQIIRYTRLLLPPELIGTHVGSAHSHTTHRHHDLGFRAGTALWGHMGIECDLTKLDPVELDQLAAWVRLHKSLRGLLHRGTTVNADHPDPQIWISGVVDHDRRQAIFGVTAVGRSVTWPPGRARLPGLDPALDYRIWVEPLSVQGLIDVPRPAWTTSELRLSGRILEVVGLELLPLPPEHSYLLHLEADG